MYKVPTRIEHPYRGRDPESRRPEGPEQAGLLTDTSELLRYKALRSATPAPLARTVAGGRRWSPATATATSPPRR